VPFRQVRCGQSDKGVQLIHRTACLDAIVALLNPLPAKEARLPEITRPRIDLNGFLLTQAFGRNQTFVQSRTMPWGGLFLKSDFIGFQTFPAFGGEEAPKGRYMKSDSADFIYRNFPGFANQ
jgi:hypothetical protein